MQCIHTTLCFLNNGPGRALSKAERLSCFLFYCWLTGAFTSTLLPAAEHNKLSPVLLIFFKAILIMEKAQAKVEAC